MKTIKVGTIGYGGAFNMGRQHLKELLSHPGFVASAVCDLDPERLKVAQTDFPGIATFTDVGQMLDRSDVELLVIILPHNTHGPVGLQCLQAGRHVIIEKPFALTVDECDAMIAEAAQRQLLLSTYHNRHWDSNIRTIVKHLPKIGRPFRWESCHGWHGKPNAWWRSDKKISGGIIYDWGAHFMEWMLQCMPYEMTEIAGFAVNGHWGFSNEDELDAMVRFGPNASARHLATSLAMFGRDPIRIQAEEGAIVWNWREVEVIQYSPTGEKVSTFVKNEPAANEEYYKNIHAHLFQGEPLVITPQWSRRVIQILEGATRSGESAQIVIPRYS